MAGNPAAPDGSPTGMCPHVRVPGYAEHKMQVRHCGERKVLNLGRVVEALDE
ncbi:hypothetical protein GCM10018965_030450 [Nonomuraea roseola]